MPQTVVPRTAAPARPRSILTLPHGSAEPPSMPANATAPISTRAKPIDVYLPQFDSSALGGPEDTRCVIRTRESDMKSTFSVGIA